MALMKMMGVGALALSAIVGCAGGSPEGDLGQHVGSKSVVAQPTPTPPPAYDIDQGWSLGTIGRNSAGYMLDSAPSRRMIAVGDVIAETMKGPDARVKYQGMVDDIHGKRAIFVLACTYGLYDNVTKTTTEFDVAEGGFLKADLLCPALSHGYVLPPQKLELRLESINERGEATITANIIAVAEQQLTK